MSLTTFPNDWGRKSYSTIFVTLHTSGKHILVNFVQKEISSCSEKSSHLCTGRHIADVFNGGYNLLLLLSFISLSLLFPMRYQFHRRWIDPLLFFYCQSIYEIMRKSNLTGVIGSFRYKWTHNVVWEIREKGKSKIKCSLTKRECISSSWPDVFLLIYLSINKSKDNTNCTKLTSCGSIPLLRRITNM